MRNDEQPTITGIEPATTVRRIPCKVVFDGRGEFVFAMPADEPEEGSLPPEETVRDGLVEVGG